MEKGYVLDIKRNDINDYTLNLDNINEMKEIDLDINSNLKNFEIALNKDNLKEAKNLLEILTKLTEYGDKQVSDANILLKAKEIILFYKEMDKNSIVDSMIISIKIRKFFNFLCSQITFNSNDEKFRIIDKIHEIRNNILIEDLIKQEAYDEISLEDLENVVKFKRVFSDEKFVFVDNVYKSFENKLNNKIKQLDNYKNILKNRYKKDFYCSNEYKDLNIKNNIKDYNQLITVFDKCYLLYKFNRSNLIKEKEVILMELLGNNFINLSGIYRYYVIENISDRKEKYTIVGEFINVANKVIENIRKQDDILNAIII